MSAINDDYSWYKGKMWDNLYDDVESSWLDGNSMDQWSLYREYGKEWYFYEPLYELDDKKIDILKYPIESLSNPLEIWSCQTIKLGKPLDQNIDTHMDKFNDDDSGFESDESSFWYDEWKNNERKFWLNRALTNRWSDNSKYNMAEHLDELPYDVYESYDHKDRSKYPEEPMRELNKHPSECDQIYQTNNKTFNILSRMLDKMTQMMTMLQEISEALPPQEEVVHDVLNSVHDDHYITNNRPNLDDGNQQEFRIRDCVDELNILEGVPNPISVETNIIVDATTDVKVEITTNIELKSILNESVEKAIHFLAIAEKVPTKEIDEFNSFSSDKGNKARVTKTSHDMEGRKLKAIISQKTI
ncbi:hypothetical protein PVK06_029752 [Gossypium arboreum]|uniref:Uncharacterized protein n=1 Tax=Gossypium arboreum TaxID=29729 RepID=A0ABR0NLF2_GOSAR|nr:hypothetical protein PVK06_029752 [Gossypium arboreum]